MLLYLLVGAFFSFSFSSPSLSSTSERIELESFFRLLFKKSEFGYTLFGQKPMSFYSYFIKLPPDSVIFANFTEPKIEKNFRTYSKYKDVLSSEKYIIIDQTSISNKFSTSGMARDIFVINRNAFTETVNKYLSLFEKKLDERISAENMLKDIEAGKNILFDVLKEDELLWGILLGYGPHNAEIYARREAIIEGRVLFATHDYLTLEEELEAIDSTLAGFTHEYFIDQIPLPMFLCDTDHTETKLLKTEYQQVQKKIVEIYNSPNFLDQVLERLHSG